MTQGSQPEEVRQGHMKHSQDKNFVIARVGNTLQPRYDGFRDVKVSHYSKEPPNSIYVAAESYTI